MAEAVGIDKDRPKEAVTVAVKMLKGKKTGWLGIRTGDVAVLSHERFLFWHLNSVIVGRVKEHIAELSPRQAQVGCKSVPVTACLP